jgi:hypothetical protein
MPTLNDVDIAPVQRADQSRGMVIPRPGGLGGIAGGHSRGGGPSAGHRGVPAGGGAAGSCSGAPAPAGGRGGDPTGGFGPTSRSGPAGSSIAALAPGKGKQARVILDDDEVSSDEDEPL